MVNHLSATRDPRDAWIQARRPTSSKMMFGNRLPLHMALPFGRVYIRLTAATYVVIIFVSCSILLR